MDDCPAELQAHEAMTRLQTFLIAIGFVAATAITGWCGALYIFR